MLTALRQQNPQNRTNYGVKNAAWSFPFLRVYSVVYFLVVEQEKTKECSSTSEPCAVLPRQSYHKLLFFTVKENPAKR